MIDSPAQHVEDIFSKFPRDERKTKSTQEKEERLQNLNLIRGHSVTSVFAKMSFHNRLDFFKELIEKIQSLDTVRLFLTTLQAVQGKITSYCLATNMPSIVFDRILYDHDRMLEPLDVQEIVEETAEWFQNLNDQDQVAYLINLLRYSDGSLQRMVYSYLRKYYCQRLSKKADAQDPTKSEGGIGEIIEQDYEFEHDVDNPKYQKLLVARKNWQKLIEALRKKVGKDKKADVSKEKKKDKKSKDKKGKKAKDKKGKKAKEKKGKKKKGKKDKKKKGKGSKDKDELDWIQVMPIWIVKRIFNYLDKKTLTKAKKVNSYWKWAIGELMKDRKEMKRLDLFRKKLKAGMEQKSKLPSDSLEPKRPKLSRSERKLKDLDNRGAIIDKLRLSHLEATDTSAVLVETLKIANEDWYGDALTMYPRIARMDDSLYKTPKYVIKDLNMIRRVQDDCDDEKPGLRHFSTLISDKPLI